MKWYIVEKSKSSIRFTHTIHTPEFNTCRWAPNPLAKCIKRWRIECRHHPLSQIGLSILRCSSLARNVSSPYLPDGCDGYLA